MTKVLPYHTNSLEYLPKHRNVHGLRLVEEVQQLPLRDLSQGCVGTLGSQRRIASEAAFALGAPVPSSNRNPNSSFP